MPRHSRVHSESGIYHIVERGINKQLIFEEQSDCMALLDILTSYKANINYKLFAYCLMGNHFHLIMKEGDESISDTMRRINVCYSQKFNRKYGRCGHLFQNRFQSNPVNTEAHLLTAIHYIHQNPVKAGLCAQPSEYVYSSYKDYENGVFLELLDKAEAIALVGLDNVLTCKESFPSDVGFAESRLSDIDANAIIHEISNCDSIAQFQSLSTEKRNFSIREFRNHRLSLRQISRLTGVSIGVIRNIR